MREFKADDKVYFPFKTNRVITVEQYQHTNYPILAGGHSFTLDGKYEGSEPVPSLLHATPRTHALLEELYGVEFEKPPIDY